MATAQPDPYGAVPAPDRAVLEQAEAYEEDTDSPVAGGRWYIVPGPDGQERVLHQRPSGDWTGSIFTPASLRAMRTARQVAPADDANSV
jgi:hypothetical protein